MSDLHELTALEQAAAIAEGELSPVELTDHYLGRIEEADKELGAYLTVTAELARSQAERAEREAVAARRDGRLLGALHGVPVPIKDLVQVDGVRCTWGSAVFAGHVSDTDDHVATRLREAGTVMLGKTNTAEFGLPCYTENRLGPPTRHPLSPGHSPGGSSGGAAAAVAAGLAPLAHGTDAGGSVRIPASVCGLVGLKPSRGRISNGPWRPDVTGLSVHGALARTVADAAALVDVMAGRMPGDVYTAPAHAGGVSLVEHARREPRAVRVAVLRRPMVPDALLHPDCEDALDSTAAALAALGHEVEELEMPPDGGVLEAFTRVWSVEAASYEVEPEREGELMPFTAWLRQTAAGVSARDYHQALATFRGLGQMLTDLLFAAYDVILSPALAEPPVRIGELRDDTDPVAEFARMTAFMPYTAVYNLTGMPSITVPLTRNAERLPIGVLLGGRYADEALLVSLAAQLQQSATTY
ncbi:amidase [Streptomyces sp. WI04-05B]|uniref:amidase n=1 Tax=Streptomyces TaxID=1883 RepID=UPI0029B6C35F|nr:MULTISPECIES: amidase [unclassified Streptomyces]MDX2546406.1 amidase [Streptomyces sp. WI04-05B]MDX2586233.1 amidase [Streptomyces sp. WI04-05A]